MAKSKAVFFAVLAVILGVILLQNTQVVEMQILFWNVSMSRIILLPLIFLSGLAIGYFWGKKVF
jgi:uncharacterized integral membrane protein